MKIKVLAAIIAVCFGVDMAFADEKGAEANAKKAKEKATKERLIKRFEQAGGGAILPPGVKSEDPPPVSKDDRVVIARGTVVGTVTAKAERGLTLRSASGKSLQFLEHWENGRKATKGMEEVKVGDLVVLDWLVNDHWRVLSVKRYPSGDAAR